jgi:hypothetical protein
VRTSLTLPRMQRDRRSICMGTSSVSIGIAGLYWSYFMSCIQKEAVSGSVSNDISCLCWSYSMPFIQKEFAATSTNILLLHFHIWHLSLHLSLVMNGVREGLKKDMYGYQQCIKCYSWPILITIYVMYSERGCCYNAHKYFAVACSYLMHRQSYVTAGDEWSQSDSWRRTGMGTSSVSNGIVGLYWS